MATTPYKILFTGTMGVGKTTCIAALSEIPPVRTEAANTDTESSAKASTTVAMDYGQITLDGDEKVHLVATPGQLRFDFMWPILAKGALGVILLVDNSRPDPLADLRTYVERLRACRAVAHLVIGVGRTEAHTVPSMEAYHVELERLGLRVPVISVDVRRREDARLLVSVLLADLEFAGA